MVTCQAASSSSWPSAAPRLHAHACSFWTNPTEGIQPNIIKDIGRVIAHLRDRGDMAILLVEQYFDFARDLAQTIAVMDRGDIVLAGRREELQEADVRGRLSV